MSTTKETPERVSYADLEPQIDQLEKRIGKRFRGQAVKDLRFHWIIGYPSDSYGSYNLHVAFLKNSGICLWREIGINYNSFPDLDGKPIHHIRNGKFDEIIGRYYLSNLALNEELTELRRRVGEGLLIQLRRFAIGKISTRVGGREMRRGQWGDFNVRYQLGIYPLDGRSIEEVAEGILGGRFDREVVRYSL